MSIWIKPLSSPLLFIRYIKQKFLTLTPIAGIQNNFMSTLYVKTDKVLTKLIVYKDYNMIGNFDDYLDTEREWLITMRV